MFALSLLLALTLDPALVKDLQWRNVGPAIMGGRIDDVAAVESNPDVIYVGAATGGVWKTENGGTTWAPVFDAAGTTSIGDIAVAPSNPNIVWVGTGEPNNRQSASWGNGVWKSTDAGRTWQHMGLADTHHIGRIVVDPQSADVVYVAAQGHLWGPNGERGLFKTTDGGRTWRNTKFIDQDTGFNDVAIDPSNPNVLYASAYQRRRTPWGFNGGGAGSGLYRTGDAGRTWTRLAKGLPAGDLGRIGIDVFRRNPSIVYATIEHAKEGGLYRSTDAGRTWAKVNALNPRPSYFSQVRVDPQNERRIYVLGSSLFVSDDGGRTFRSDGARNVHVDHHALWIDPARPTSLVLGNDGGVFLSRDASRTWTRVNTIPLGQFYTVGADMRQPAWLYGGLQDNGVWSGPSATWNRVGPLNDDWIQVSGGDGMYVAPDPLDTGTAYVSTQDGRLMRFDTRSGERKGIRPYVPDPAQDEPAPGGDGAKTPKPLPLLRFSWTTPVLVSPHNPRTLYLAGNRLWRSLDRGERWVPISPDLTRQIDRDTLRIMGRMPDDTMLSKHDGVTHYGTATALAESPVRPGLLLVGTDDGQVQITTDGGASWTEISSRFAGVPERTAVSRAVLSAHDARRMFVAFDGHRQDIFAPLLYRSDDAGATWRAATAGLDAVVRTVTEDPRNPDLLFAGLENGVAFSLNGGVSWVRLKNGLPDVPVPDIQIHPRDRTLILGTHGRSIYLMNIAALEDLTAPARERTVHLFEPARATAFRFLEHRDFLGQATYVGANPPYGAVVSYWLRDAAAHAPELTIEDPDGTVVRRLKGAAGAGLHHVVWDLRYENPPQPPRPEPTDGVDPADPRPAESTAARVPGDFGGGGDPTGGEAGEPRRPVEGPEVLPGEYTVRLASGGETARARLVVQADPRIDIPDEDRRARFTLLWQVYELQQQAYPVQQRVADLTRQLQAITKALGAQKDAAADLKKAGDDAAKALRDLQTRLGCVLGQAVGAARDVQGSTSAPTEAQRAQLADAAARAPAAITGIDRFVATTLTAFADDLAARAPAGIPRLKW